MKPTIRTGLGKAALALGAVMLATLSAPQQSYAGSVEAGMLTCRVAGGVGFIFGSSKALECRFNRPEPLPDEHYSGAINKFGIDIGVTGETYIAWLVLAPTVDVPPGALAGGYAGATAEATAGAGVGANVMIGGSDKSISLQPVSVQGQTGLNVAAGIASISLEFDGD